VLKVINPAKPGRTDRAEWKRQLWITVGGITVVVLAAAVFTLGSLDIPVHPAQGNTLVVFFALSSFIFAALLVFALILARSLLKLWAEKRSGKMGSRFKAKMVLGALGISLTPLVFLFFFSYALVNRTLGAWFPRPLELATEDSRALMEELGARGHTRMGNEAAAVCGELKNADNFSLAARLERLSRVVDAIWFVKEGKVTAMAPVPENAADLPELRRVMDSGGEIWSNKSGTFVAASQPCLDGKMVAGRNVPDDYLERYNEIEAQTQLYWQQKEKLRAYKRELLVALLLITLLVMFVTTWMALFLSKQVAVPIQALAEGTREISRGNFDHRIHAQAQDELGMLVASFNRMTEQLGEGRRQINEFTRSLEEAIEEREERRKLMEALLESIPAGVVSLNSAGEVLRVNSSLTRMIGEKARGAGTLSELLGEEAARDVMQLMRRSLRMGAAAREIEMAVGGKLVRAAVTVSALGPRRSNPGFVVVIDDLTDLLRAQKAAAWQEVAQRIAHEIKNPLTPIQLSAQRLIRYLDRTDAGNGNRSEFEKLVAECARLIEREVSTLGALVDAFSQFARFPAARLAPADLNTVVFDAMEQFQGRLEGIEVSVELATGLPAVKADHDLLRRVIANLVDNAAEAMEGSKIRRLRVATRVGAHGDSVEIEIADSGQGISPEDKERLFLPHFSTKERGTGLGLAIASRIVSEHHGTIRLEDNLPAGAKFVLRFPAAEIVKEAPTVQTV
jgi:two-component system, NtrC family, nitrogen regulation sensor histidine kinase NtrY